MSPREKLPAAAAAKDRVSIPSPPPQTRIERATLRERSNPTRPALIVVNGEHIAVNNAIVHAAKPGAKS